MTEYDFLLALRYASAVLAVGLCLCVGLSFCHKPTLCQNGRTNLAPFGTKAFLDISSTMLLVNSGSSKNKRKSVHITHLISVDLILSELSTEYRNMHKTSYREASNIWLVIARCSHQQLLASSCTVR